MHNMRQALQRAAQVAAHNSAGKWSRRDWLTGISAACGCLAWGSWSPALQAQAEALKRQGKACILLWMQGGPSQFETFDPKPQHGNGGETKAISTAVPGIQIAEHYPQLAKQFQEIALIRSLTSKEGSHPRATTMMHTGYIPTASVKHPAMGSVVSKYLGAQPSDLPNFVRVGGKQANLGNAGILGVTYDPFDLDKAGETPRNADVPVTEQRLKSRMELMRRLAAAKNPADPQTLEDHAALYESAARMVLSPRMDVFNLETVPAAERKLYGTSEFANGCLLARRLVESGVPFIEVSLGNWDTHADNFTTTQELAANSDQAMAGLLSDLKARGLLDKTLVVWMGEFGRTPRINPRGGRDHFPKASNLWLAGCGIRGGQVVGSTTADGSAVQDRPVSVKDLYQTIYKALGLNPGEENQAGNGRPIKLVDEGQPIAELWS